MLDFGTIRIAKEHLQDVAFFLYDRAFTRAVKLLERLKRWFCYENQQKSLKKEF
jgi:hypothetical protein